MLQLRVLWFIIHAFMRSEKLNSEIIHSFFHVFIPIGALFPNTPLVVRASCLLCYFSHECISDLDLTCDPHTSIFNMFIFHFKVFTWWNPHACSCLLHLTGVIDPPGLIHHLLLCRQNAWMNEYKQIHSHKQRDLSGDSKLLWRMQSNTTYVRERLCAIFTAPWFHKAQSCFCLAELRSAHNE